MSRETFERAVDEELLEPVNDKPDSTPPPEVYRAALEQEHEQVQRALEGLQAILDYNRANQIATPRELQERYDKLREQTRKLAAQLERSHQLGLFSEPTEPRHAPASRAA